MQVFQNIDAKTFTYNNKKYVKNFILMAIGDTHVSAYNAFDVKLQLLPPTHFSDVRVNGLDYPTQTQLMNVLAPIIFAKSVENDPLLPSWGTITGLLSSQTDLNNALAGKFNIPTGTTAQYVRGNGTLATLPAAAIWGNITGSISGQTDLVGSLNSKLNKSGNTEFERLSELSDIHSPVLFTRTGSLARSNSLSWDEGVKKLTIKGTQAIWEASSEVTSGNMGIKALSGAAESFKIFDNFGNFFSTGTISGKKQTRVFTPFRLVNGVSYSETEYKTVEALGDTVPVATTIKEIQVPLNTHVTIDVNNINIVNVDSKSIIGSAQFSVKNEGGTVTSTSRDDLRYGRQWSYIRNTPNYVTSADTRIDLSISGTTAKIEFINNVNKVTNVHCEIKHNLTEIPTTI